MKAGDRVSVYGNRGQLGTVLAVEKDEHGRCITVDWDGWGIEHAFPEDVRPAPLDTSKGNR